MSTKPDLAELVVSLLVSSAPKIGVGSWEVIPKRSGFTRWSSGRSGSGHGLHGMAFCRETYGKSVEMWWRYSNFLKNFLTVSSSLPFFWNDSEDTTVLFPFQRWEMWEVGSFIGVYICSASSWVEEGRHALSDRTGKHFFKIRWSTIVRERWRKSIYSMIWNLVCNYMECGVYL